MCAFIVFVFWLEDNNWWVSSGHGDGNNRKKKQCNWWCAACGGQYDWRACCTARTVRQSDQLAEALQKDGDSQVENIVTGRNGNSHVVILQTFTLDVCRAICNLLVWFRFPIMSGYNTTIPQVLGIVWRGANGATTMICVVSGKRTPVLVTLQETIQDV